MQSMLIFSVALNGYQWIYKKHLASQQAYADKIGAHYRVVTKPFFSQSGVECCWYKLHLLKQAIQSGYKHILFLDADCFVQPDCPDIRENFTEAHSIYMARSYSGRFNSGVILVKGAESSLNFFDKVIASRHNKLDKQDSVGWGENGHVIACAKNVDYIGELDIKWNNTSEILLSDFIRHENFGPLRQNKLLNLCHKAFNRFSSVTTKVQSSLRQLPKHEFYQNNAQKELQIILETYPEFSKPF